MGTVDFWVPVNRHRREPGGPHDTIISFSTIEVPEREPKPPPGHMSFESGSKNGTRAVSVTTQKFPHFHPRGSGARPDLSFTRQNALATD